jgi:hypothetical protein
MAEVKEEEEKRESSSDYKSGTELSLSGRGPRTWSKVAATRRKMSLVTSHLTPHASFLTRHTSRVTPHTSHFQLKLTEGFARTAGAARFARTAEK